MLILSTNVDQKSLETKYSIAICRQLGDKLQSKTLFLAIFDPRSSVVKTVFDCRLSHVVSFGTLQSYIRYKYVLTVFIAQEQQKTF